MALGGQPTNAAGRRLQALMKKHGGLKRVRLLPRLHISSAFGEDCCPCVLFQIWRSMHFASHLAAVQLALNEVQVKAELGLSQGIAYTPHTTSPKRRGARRGRANRKRCETSGGLIL